MSNYNFSLICFVFLLTNETYILQTAKVSRKKIWIFKIEKTNMSALLELFIKNVFIKKQTSITFQMSIEYGNAVWYITVCVITSEIRMRSFDRNR